MEDGQTEVQERRKWTRIPFERGSPEYLAEKRRRALEYYYKVKKPEKAAEKPKSPGDAPAMPKRMPIVWKTPDDLRFLFGDQITLDAEWTRWPLFHVRRQSDLSKTTMNQYKSYYYRLPPGDPWNQVRFVIKQVPATQNMYAKAALSYVCDSLYNSLYIKQTRNLAYDDEYKNRLLKMQIWSFLNKKTKAESYERHASQEASESRIEATVPWQDWVQLGKNYLRAMAGKKTLTEKEKRDTLLVWAYSQMPPVRLDWNDMKVVRVKGGKVFDSISDTHKGGNVMYVGPKGVVICWSEFKNSAQFKDLPIKHTVMGPAVIRMMKKVLPEGDSEPLKMGESQFSRYLTRLAEDITGKPFSNRLMRSSYIQWWHQHNDTTNVKAVQAMMRQIHQTNIQVHLGYIKHSTTNGELSDG